MVDRARFERATIALKVRLMQNKKLIKTISYIYFFLVVRFCSMVNFIKIPFILYIYKIFSGKFFILTPIKITHITTIKCCRYTVIVKARSFFSSLYVKTMRPILKYSNHKKLLRHSKQHVIFLAICE